MLHANITARREKLGLRKIDLARKMGVGKSTVTGWEKGVVPRPQLLERLAAVLQTSVSKLYAERS